MAIIKYVWDSSVFIGVMNNQSDLPVDEIKLISKEITDKQSILLVPAVIHAELLLVKYQQEVIDKLNEFLDRENVQKNRLG